MAFTAKDVMSLRETTGAGMMDCKKALIETDGDMEKAIVFLREKGLAAAAKKASRIAAEGVVAAAIASDGSGALVEINSETDFAAKTEKFLKYTDDIASVVVNQKPADLEALKACKYVGSDLTVAEVQQENVLVIGENIGIRRFEIFESGVNVPYIHMGGKIGVLVNLNVSDNLKGNSAVTELGRDIAMQIAAMRPLWLTSAEADPETVAKEKEIFMSQAQEQAAGKPANVVEKMVEGRIRKYFQEVCLLEQAFVKDNKLTVAQHVAAVAKELGGEITVAKFVRYERGEGMAKREDNFADEVAGMVK